MRPLFENASPTSWAGAPLLALSLALAVGGCAVTNQAAHEDVKRSGFLGDYSKLEAANPETGHALYRYVNPAAQWRQYNKIQLQPVTYWGDDQSKLSPEDQQALTTYFYNELKKQLGTKFELVEAPGPGVMSIQVALTDAHSATPVLRSVSLVVPQARTLNTLQHVVTGSWAGAGDAGVEVRVRDAATGQTLGELVDKRVGGSHIQAAAQWQWGDVTNAIDEWSLWATARLHAWTTGAATPGESPPSS